MLLAKLSLSHSAYASAVEVALLCKLVTFLISFQMYSALADEIKRLSRVLEEFDRPFQPNPTELVVYKKVANVEKTQPLSK